MALHDVAKDASTVWAPSGVVVRVTHLLAWILACVRQWGLSQIVVSIHIALVCRSERCWRRWSSACAGCVGFAFGPTRHLHGITFPATESTTTSLDPHRRFGRTPVSLAVDAITVRELVHQFGGARTLRCGFGRTYGGHPKKRRNHSSQISIPNNLGSDSQPFLQYP